MSIEDILGFCLDHSFNAMELEINTANFNPASVKESTLAWIKQLSESGTISFGMHSPADINFSDPPLEIRLLSEKKVKDALRLGSKLGVNKVVVHPGRVVGDFTLERWRQAWEQNVAAIRRCAEFSRELGVSVSVENLCHEKNSVNPDIASFLSMCEEIGLSLIGICLDTNHAGLVDGLEKSVAVIDDYVDYIHFSSNKGVKSDHCEPDIGVIDFFAVADFFRKFTGLTIIELNELGEDSAGAVLRTRSYLDKLQHPGKT